ncbi:MAG: winged helix-turn-helix transcriptional regulator [Anaerolineae bacterium]|nr:winged helix-turn-helix transcriptional regulator [Anaerolineae bacterium]
MPLEVIESTDPLTGLIRFETSPVFEMLISLHVLLAPDAQPEWRAQTRAALSPELLQELEAVYGPYWNGFLFLELAVDCPDHQDVPGFIRYVRAMTPDRFLFYLVGRMIPVEAIAATGGNAEALEALLEATQFEPGCMCREVPMREILADVPAFQRRLTDLWQRYWDEFFHTQPPLLRPHWEHGLDDKRAVLNCQGGMALYEYVTGRSEPLPALPPNYPVRDVVFIPLYRTGTPVLMFYGYGNVTILFDSERTGPRAAQIEESKARALGVLKALGDNSRLDILRLIARHESRMNGKRIAEKLNLSASAVSRHLAQLKEAGLILEEAQDNRTITYRLQREAITSLPDRVLDYLLH